MSSGTTDRSIFNRKELLLHTLTDMLRRVMGALHGTKS